jgi:hypothetical protein
LNIDNSIAGKLRQKVDYWQHTGAKKTLIKWITHGFKPIFTEVPAARELPSYPMTKEAQHAWAAVREKWLSEGAIR